MTDVTVRSTRFEDTNWIRRRVVELWGSSAVVVHGEVYHPEELPGFVATATRSLCGFLSFHAQGGACEIVAHAVSEPGQGTGSALLAATEEAALALGCKRLWLVTTNDNLRALRFYQRRGFVLQALRPGAMTEARKVKPEVPLQGEHGIEIRDELELEKIL